MYSLDILKEIYFNIRIRQKKIFSFFIRLKVILLNCIFIDKMNHLNQNMSLIITFLLKLITSIFGTTINTTTLWGY